MKHPIITAIRNTFCLPKDIPLNPLLTQENAISMTGMTELLSLLVDEREHAPKELMQALEFVVVTIKLKKEALPIEKELLKQVKIWIDDPMYEINPDAMSHAHSPSEFSKK